VSLLICVRDDPNSFLIGFSLAKDSVAGEFDSVRKHGRGIPTLHPITLPLGTEKRESRVGNARQIEASGATDLLCNFLRKGGVCKGDKPTRENYFESNHKYVPPWISEWTVSGQTPTD
jgi:hypothetical protein